MRAVLSLICLLSLQICVGSQIRLGLSRGDDDGLPYRLMCPFPNYSVGLGPIKSGLDVMPNSPPHPPLPFIGPTCEELESRK